jgi:hypothetical protein
VLLIGNSLLLEGIDYPELQRILTRELKVTRFVVENTTYLDWYYGLRRILHKGARPAAVVLVLSPRQFLSPQIQGDLFANLLLDRQDLLRVARETGADRTATTSLLLDTVSDFYGSRAEIRNWVLHSVMPNSGQLGDFMRPHTPPIIEDEALVALAASRLAQMHALAGQYGAKFVLVVPPQLSLEGVRTLERAAVQTNTTFSVPLGPGVLPAANFRDGFHLNPMGAAAFTLALARELRRLQLSSSEVLENSVRRKAISASMCRSHALHHRIK